MTVQEVYEKSGGGYDEIIAKFHSDAIIGRFLKMFAADGNYAALCERIEAADADGAFGAAHNLKGLILNLNFKGLTAPVHDVTEALRAKDIKKAEELMPALKSAYACVIEAIEQLA